MLVRWDNRPVYFSWFNPPATNWQHLKSRIDASEQMFSTEPSRSPQGAFCNPPSHPLHRADRYFYHWPLDRWAMTHVATGPAPLGLRPSDAVELGRPELLSKEVHEWEGRSFYGGETGPGLSSAVTLFQGPLSLLTLSPLKNSRHPSTAKAKQTGRSLQGLLFLSAAYGQVRATTPTFWWMHSQK